MLDISRGLERLECRKRLFRAKQQVKVAHYAQGRLVIGIPGEEGALERDRLPKPRLRQDRLDFEQVAPLDKRADGRVAPAILPSLPDWRGDRACLRQCRIAQMQQRAQPVHPRHPVNFAPGAHGQCAIRCRIGRCFSQQCQQQASQTGPIHPALLSPGRKMCR